MNDPVLPLVTLTTDRLLLRPFGPADAADVHAVWQDTRFIDSAPLGYAYAGADFDVALAWCTSGIEERRRTGKGIGFAVVLRDGGRLVGHVSLFGADWTAMSAEMHYWTAPWARGHGVAAEAAAAVARWALTTQGFARIALQAAPANTASRHVAERAGFQAEGVLRNVAVSRNGRHDLVMYSMIPSDLGVM
ncbi:GNAT family N-acetyltransferase [Dactylosporangium sp. NBC_01737]|uniref:GNAT family N-acetyltransferase n=1 Tax=Dactylosporangium sp. NBC_01737 TaxID=2975959 RepID=UPI002E151640|nr:GNAT family N-acetyltransferase [Dactylosporangium sp. NBC_01737]